MTNATRPRYSNDERLTEAQREQHDDAHHALQSRGMSGSGADGGGVGAAGAVVAPLIIIGSFVVFMLYACFFPVAAAVALLTGVIVSKVFDLLVPGVGWIAHFLIVLPWAFAALVMFRQREWRLERLRGYVLARHVLRLMFTAVVVGSSTTFFAETDNLHSGMPLDESLSWLHFALVVAAVFVVHFVGRWLDRRSVEMSGDAAHDRAPARSSWRAPGMAALPPPLRNGLPAMALAGGMFGAFLGYAAFETSASTLVGLFVGCLGGALLMFVCWLVTRPVGALFERVPLLWPVLMGAIIGAAVGWRLALADQASPAAYLPPGAIGGALALAVPYLLYAVARRLVARPT